MFTRLFAFCLAIVFATHSFAKDPCGMVPPIYTGDGAPITRIGLQQTYVFYKDGVETFVIRPGFQGKVDNFGMLIPFPSAPSLRKVPDNVFPQIANAVDPPEVTVWVGPQFGGGGFGGGGFGGAMPKNQALSFRDTRERSKVVVVKREAVGMYEVAVLEAGSSAALKKWMDKNGFKYPKGMDKVCDEYIEARWCFVAVKTKVNQSAGVQPKAGQRKVKSKLPSGSTFDGHVQGMGFRFKTDELVVPMRLSAFNEGETRNIVYLLTDSPKKIRAIPEEYVQRQISGKNLVANVTQPLPLRIMGGTERDIQKWQRAQIKKDRNPEPKNGVAKELFASDLMAISSGKLSLEHEEMEKELLRIGEHFGLRGPEIDKSNALAVKSERQALTKRELKQLNSMTLTVLDGDFPREVLSSRNLTFATYKMPSRRNNFFNYDSKTNKPGQRSKQGILKLGAIDWTAVDAEKTRMASKNNWLPLTIGLLGIGLCLGVVFVRRRKTLAAMIAVGCVLTVSTATAKDPCGMVPPIYTGPGAPITRIGLQQTYVFYKDGVETFVIRPGFQGKVDNFGMLIPFPSAPALRKVPDNVFAQVANAVDPPEVVVDLRMRLYKSGAVRSVTAEKQSGMKYDGKKAKDKVTVLKREAVGMYEVAVLEAGSSAALKKWMDKNGFKYPKGMDKVCDEYIELDWCFVAVKTKVNQADGVQPQAGQRKVNPNLPSGSTFDGHVQGMGFRFKTDELVVPMRLSAFNEGETRNIVYLLTDSPKKIRAIPEEYVQRQLSGADLITNVTKPLPLRIIGGTEKNLTDWHKKWLPEQRKPEPKNGVAKRLFASDLTAIASGNLSLEHEEMEKEFLRIGEHFGLRGPEIDKSNADALAEMADKATKAALKDLKSMTLTVLDGDFPREVLSSRNLTFATYKMPARRNNSLNYDPKTNKPGIKREGFLKIGAVDWSHLEPTKTRHASKGLLPITIGLLGLSVCLGMVIVRRRKTLAAMIAVGCVVAASTATAKDPCGMVPPIYTGKGAPITRIGLQQTYVFYKDGVETFVIRPGFQGKVDNFGMLIPFPSAPALRKVPDNVFSQVANAVDPPEVVVDLRMIFANNANASGVQLQSAMQFSQTKSRRNRVKVLKREAVGMYEVAVLEAGSSAALKKWMDKNGFKYPKGMDKVCDEYIELKWCFVAVKTKVNQAGGVQPKAGQRKVNPNLPSGSTFDGHVQGMGFRFKTDELVVPMRLSAFNEGETRNIVYLLTDSPKKIRAIPEEYVQRQLTGKDLIANITKPLPLRIIGGTEKSLTDWHRKSLPAQRKPEPKNGVAKRLFASDLTAIATGNLSLEHEEMEKEFLRIGEHFGLRGPEIDKSNTDALAEMADKATKSALKDLNSMTLTVLDGDFPREVLSSRNLKFATYKMPSRRNNSLNYDPKTNKPGAKKEGVLKIGAVDWSHLEPTKTRHASKGLLPITIGLLGLSVCLGMVIVRRRKTLAAMIAVGCVVTASAATAKDPCGMVPPIYTGKGAPITRIGLQQTYVFYKDGVETFVIRPGFQGKVDNFGMLIPFPSAPALRKVPDNVFAQVANAVDPPEVVVDLRMRKLAAMNALGAPMQNRMQFAQGKSNRHRVKVLKREAVGMYEVAVLEAGSSAALKKWMDKNGFKYPKGMDKVCDEYIEIKWCFVAVKTKVNQSDGVQPRAGQRKVSPNLPSGSTFDGHVQGMGFRFKTDELVVPMRLSAFNEGETRNIVYLLSDSPKKIRAIPEEYVQRQLSGADLIANVTKPLPLRIIGGTEKNLTDWHRKSLPAQRKPGPKNGVAKQLFASDLTAIASGNLSLEHEEMEKEFLRIGEHFGLRGPEIDKSNADALTEMADKATKSALKDLKSMTLTVLDGDFPREVLSSRNLTFATYKMPARRNNSLNYDPKTNKPGVKKQGVLKIGAVDWSHLDPQNQNNRRVVSARSPWLILTGLIMLSASVLLIRKRKTRTTRSNK